MKVTFPMRTADEGELASSITIEVDEDCAEPVVQITRWTHAATGDRGASLRIYRDEWPSFVAAVDDFAVVIEKPA